MDEKWFVEQEKSMILIERRFKSMTATLETVYSKPCGRQKMYILIDKNEGRLRNIILATGSHTL